MFNAYSMKEDLRGMVAESVAKHWSDVDIIAALNKSLVNVYRKIAMSAGDWFVKQSSALTPVAGKITLPSDCSKPLYAEEVSSGAEVVLGTMTPRERALNMRQSDRLSYNSLQAWMEEGYLRINDDSYVTPVYLWYERKVLLMHAGTAIDGSFGYLYFANDRNLARKDGYYDGTIFEVVDGTGEGYRYEMSNYIGYSGFAYALIEGSIYAGSFSSSSIYGTIPVIPEEALDLLIHKALLYMILKPGSSVQKEQVYFVRDEVADAEKSFQQWASSRIKTNSRVRYTGAYSNG